MTSKKGTTRASAAGPREQILAHLDVQASTQGQASPSNAKVVAKRNKHEAELETPASVKNPVKSMNRDSSAPTSLEGAFEQETADVSKQQEKKQDQAKKAAGSRGQKAAGSDTTTSGDQHDTSPELAGSSSGAQAREQEPPQKHNKPSAQPNQGAAPKLPLRNRTLLAGVFSMGVWSVAGALRQEFSQLRTDVARLKQQGPDELLAALKVSEPLKLQLEELVKATKAVQEIEREARQVAEEMKPLQVQMEEVMGSVKELKTEVKVQQEREQEWQQVQKGQKKSYADLLKTREEMEKSIQSKLQTKLQSDLAAAQQTQREQRDREEKVHRTFKVFGAVPGTTDRDNAYTQAQAALTPLG